MCKVLIVEDETNIRNNLREILEMSGYEVTVAENGEEALIALAGEMPDIILSDILMPVMNGYDLLRNVQANPKLRHLPFLFLSAKIELEDIRNGMNLGADDYLTKPVKYQELIKAIEMRINRRKDFIDTAPRTGDGEINSTKREELQLMLTKISNSEMRVLRQLAENRNSFQIAETLFLSFKTVQNHRANMVKKLGLFGQNALLSFALNCKMLDLLLQGEEQNQQTS